jgi:hypothetical protein
VRGFYVCAFLSVRASKAGVDMIEMREAVFQYGNAAGVGGGAEGRG